MASSEFMFLFKPYVFIAFAIMSMKIADYMIRLLQM